MSRIRNVKPEFFRHEGLQDLETTHANLYPMLVFAGLWTQCDKQGVFPWKPRHLHLDILPFVEFDFSATLQLLQDAGLVCRFEADGEYGYIPTFKKHQRVSGEEAKNLPRYPAPPIEKQEGSRKEATQKQEGSKESDPSRPGVRSTEYGVGSTERAQMCEVEDQEELPPLSPAAAALLASIGIPAEARP